MSIFSRISRSRQQAREHNAKLAEKQKKEDNKAPYRHVPTHAASDAIASAPPSWRGADRVRIQEENRRRIAMSATAHHMSMPGMPRVGSSLSHVSYPTNANASPMVRVPRTHSYSSVLPYSSYHSSRDAVSYLPDVNAVQYATAYKGKEVMRPSYEAPHISPTYFKRESPSSSRTSSASSQDDLEIRNAHVPVEVAPRANASRRVSDSSIDRIAMANLARASRDSRPPTSMRPFVTAYASTSIRSPSPRAYARPTPLMTPRPERHSHVAAIEASSYMQEEEKFSDWAPPTQLNQSREVAPAESVPTAAIANGSHPKERRLAKSTRFTELALDTQTEGRAQRNGSASVAPAPAPAPPTAKTTTASAPMAMAQAPAPAPASSERYVVNVFPEAEHIPETEAKRKSRRVSKSGGKLKKSR